MAIKFCALFVFVLTTVGASDVIDLTDQAEFDKALKNDVILIEFFAPWCGHCKQLAPKYEEAATRLKSNIHPVPLAKVDCTSDNGKDICSKYGVSGYPTMKVFKSGEAKDYEGPRDADGIVSYMKKHAGPPSVHIQSSEMLTTMLENGEENVYIAYVEEGSDELEKLIAFAKTADSFASGYVTDKSIWESQGIKKACLTLYRPKHMHAKFEPATETTEYFSSIKQFVNDNDIGLVGMMTQSNRDKFEKSGKTLITAFFDIDLKKDPKGFKYIRNRVGKCHQKQHDSYVMYSVASSSAFSDIMDKFSLSSSKDATLIARNEKGQLFITKDKFSVDACKKFVDDVLKGALEPFVKSEPIPESNDEGVKVVVGKNFDEIVNDETKDVLIEFYAPWCGHCKSLEPKYKELGEKVQKDDSLKDVVIAKMDATANDVPPQYEVSGFPTIYWASKKNKDSPVKYSGGREVSAFMKYIKKEKSA